jgi:predicted MFS family arabinose efflux permease
LPNFPFSIPARLLLAKALRGFADGFVSLLLPLHLLRLGLSPLEVGVIATTTLLGSGLLTLWVGAQAGRWPLRTLLLAATLLMAGTGAALVAVQGFWPLLLVALVGTINPSGGDVSVFLPLEHAMLAHSVEPRRRTAAFARYSLVGTLAGAFGALAAALPLDPQAMFALYAAIALLAALVYRGLPRRERADAEARPAALGPSRPRVYVLAALFSLDAFGGGFVVQSLVALWLFQRFGVAVDTVAQVFFWTGLLTACSYLVAVRIAERIGLVRTMVYTHLPSSLCLLAIPFCGSLHWAVALLLVRSALSQMDVPTRSSYVMAVVTPPERPAAASVTAVPRSLAAAASPALAGYLLGVSAFGWPLVAGAVLKISYDLLLLALFRRVLPPEESVAPEPLIRPAAQPGAAPPVQASRPPPGAARDRLPRRRRRS